MAEIGPSIPAHLLKKNEEPENGAEEPDIGPQLPNLKRKAPEPEQAQTNEVDNDSDSDDDYAPALPPEFQRPAEEPKEPPRKRVAGPALPPPGAQSRYKDDSDDDQVGPSLYLASYTEDEETAALRRIAEIEGRVKKAKEANEPKEEKMERGEWMTVPPEIARLGSELQERSVVDD